MAENLGSFEIKIDDSKLESVLRKLEKTEGVKIKVNADTAKLDDEFKKAGKKSGDKFEDSFKQSVKDIDDKIPTKKLDDKFQKAGHDAGKKFSTGFKGAFAGAGLGTLAVAGLQRLAAAIPETIELAKEQALAEAKVAAAIKSTGGAAGVTQDELKKMASGLQDVTNYGDEVTLRGQSMLLTFTKIGKDVFPQATETMLNMSAAMGTDVQSSAIQLGKALNDPVAGIAALSRVGVQLSAEQKQLIKDFVKVGDTASAQKVILGELETQFGGLARATVDPITQLKNIMGDLKEVIGGVVRDVASTLAPVLKGILGTLGEVLSSVVQGIKPFLELLTSKLLPIFTKLIDKILPVFVKLIEAIVPTIETLFDVLSPIIDVLVEIGTTILSQLVTGFSSLLKALNPVIKVLGDEFGSIITELVKELMPIFVDLLNDLIPLIIEIVRALTPWITILTKVTAAVVGFFLKLEAQKIKIFAGALKGIIPILTDIIKWIGGAIQSVGEFFGLIEKKEKKAPFRKTGKDIEGLGEKAATGLGQLTESTDEAAESTAALGDSAKKTALSLADMIKELAGLDAGSKAFDILFEKAVKFADKENETKKRTDELTEAIKKRTKAYQEEQAIFMARLTERLSMLEKEKEAEKKKYEATRDARLMESDDYNKFMEEHRQQELANEEFTQGIYENLVATVESSMMQVIDGQKTFAEASLDIAYSALKSLIPILVAEITGKEIGSKGIYGLITAAALNAVLYGLYAAAKPSGAEEGVIGIDGNYKKKPGRTDTIPLMVARGEAILSRSAVNAGGQIVSNYDLLEYANKTKRPMEELLMAKMDIPRSVVMNGNMSGVLKELQDVKHELQVIKRASIDTAESNIKISRKNYNPVIKNEIQTTFGR